MEASPPLGGGGLAWVGQALEDERSKRGRLRKGMSLGKRAVYVKGGEARGEFWRHWYLEEEAVGNRLGV